MAFGPFWSQTAQFVLLKNYSHYFVCFRNDITIKVDESSRNDINSRSCIIDLGRKRTSGFCHPSKTQLIPSKPQLIPSKPQLILSKPQLILSKPQLTPSKPRLLRPNPLIHKTDTKQDGSPIQLKQSSFTPSSKNVLETNSDYDKRQQLKVLPKIETCISLTDSKISSSRSEDCPEESYLLGLDLIAIQVVMNLMFISVKDYCMKMELSDCRKGFKTN